MILWGSVFEIRLGRILAANIKCLLVLAVTLVAWPGIAFAADTLKTDSGIVYYGGGEIDFIELWPPLETEQSSTTPSLAPIPSGSEVKFGVGWRPDISAAQDADSRRIGRSLGGSEIERIGIRTDLTALIFDDNPDSAPSTAWRLSGALGYTSLSLVPDEQIPANETGADAGVLWNLGIGWSSGSISLNAGYESATNFAESEEGDKAILSLGADYTILPGLSVYGELNMVDSPVDYGNDRLGTVLILGTGLSF